MDAIEIDPAHVVPNGPHVPECTDSPSGDHDIRRRVGYVATSPDGGDYPAGQCRYCGTRFALVAGEWSPRWPLAVRA